MFDFKKFTKVDTIDAVPEQFRGLYEQLGEDAGEDAGKFVISSAAKGAVEAIMGQADALNTVRKEVKDLKASMDLSPLEAYGKTPSEIAAAISGKFEDFEAKLAEGSDAKINLEKYKEEIAKGHALELDKRDKAYNDLYSQFEDTVVTKEAVSAIAEQGGDPKLLLPFVKESIRMRKEDDGKYNVYVVDKQGDRRFDPTTGEAMSIKHAVAEMKSDAQFGKLFTSPNQEENSGGGTHQKSVQKPNPAQHKRENMSANAKISAGLAEMRK